MQGITPGIGDRKSTESRPAESIYFNRKTEKANIVVSFPPSPASIREYN